MNEKGPNEKRRSPPLAGVKWWFKFFESDQGPQPLTAGDTIPLNLKKSIIAIGNEVSLWIRPEVKVFQIFIMISKRFFTIDIPSPGSDKFLQQANRALEMKS